MSVPAHTTPFTVGPRHPFGPTRTIPVSRAYARPLTLRLDENSEEAILATLNKNALFSLFLTRALLPLLRRAAASGPVLCAFTGSIAADISPARIPVYAASKGFLRSLVRGLDNDERYFARPSGVRFVYYAVGSVHSDNHTATLAVNFRTPPAHVFARQLVARAGAPGRVIVPYTIHAVVKFFVDNLVPEGTLDDMTAAEMKMLIEEAQKSSAKAT